MRAAPAVASKEILIVEDNSDLAELASIVLSNSGYTASSCPCAEEALTRLATFRPALILMDVQLPGMDGLTLVRHLKADPATRPIVVVGLSGYAMPGDEERAREAGVDDYLTKPVDIGTLLSTVAHWVSGPDGKGSDPAGDDLPNRR